MNPKISADHLKRRAIIYIRQSSPGQVIHNQESQRRQYGLADHARQLGFQQVEIIDEDLGRSGSGQVERPGFQHLVAAVCTGQVGAVLCIEASRLARNGRDWHHLIELCGLVRTLVIDPDGVYDPGILNDRLLLGLKGTMSEFELNLLRQRSLEAIRQKARRGELQFRLPVVSDGLPTAESTSTPTVVCKRQCIWSSPRWWNWAAPGKCCCGFGVRIRICPRWYWIRRDMMSYGNCRCTTRSGTCSGIRCTRVPMLSAKRKPELRSSMDAPERARGISSRVTHGWS